jgi:hypothetical protein
VGVLFTAACSSSNSNDTSSDSGTEDSAPSTGEDSGPGFDATLPSDSGEDAAPGHDASVDSPVAVTDSSTEDASDASHGDSSTEDAGSDAASDASKDAASDAESDAAKDAETDATSDAATDASAADAGADSGEGDAGALPTSAVGIWEFQDVAGSTTAVDSSGNGHTATLKGTAAIVAGGTYGNYLHIDGTVGAFADVTGGPLFDNSKSFTVSAWVSFPSFNYNYDELISADGANASVFELQLAPLTAADGGTSYNVEAAFPTQDVPTPGVFYYAFSTAQPSVATWYHVVGVYDLTSNPGTTPGKLSLYLDGVLQSNPGDSTATGANPVAAVGDFIIGAGKYNDARTNGAVANYVGVRVYDQALSAAQVATLYGLAGR